MVTDPLALRVYVPAASELMVYVQDATFAVTLGEAQLLVLVVRPVVGLMAGEMTKFVGVVPAGTAVKVMVKTC
jgi:hypothetical protein